MSQRIISAANKLQTYRVNVGHIELVPQMIKSFDVTYMNDSIAVTAMLVVDDLVDLNMNVIWRDTPVELFYMDIFDLSVEKTFTVVNVTEAYDDKKNKTLIIMLQDEFSFKLANSYLCKSYNSNVVSIFKEFVDHLELDIGEGELDNLEDNTEIVVPKTMSNLDFFNREFASNGMVAYQNKKGIFVKHLSNLVPSKLPVQPDDYLNETNNQLYQNRIISLRGSINTRENILPITESIAYNIEKKAFDLFDDNKNESYVLADDVFNLQETQFTGMRAVIQHHLNFDDHTLQLKNSFEKQSELEMVVNGYEKNDINQVYELLLMGNKGSADTQAKGNMTLNGKYVCHKLVDKLIGDTLLQKVFLRRSDLTKVT